jgi:hypothetical protein
MKKIYFDENTFIWKKKLNLVKYKDSLLEEANKIIKSQPESKHDGFGVIYWTDSINSSGELNISNKMDEITQIGINECKKIYEDDNIPFNKVNLETWVNRIRHKKPVQTEFWKNNVDKYHVHTDINKKLKTFHPDFTFVYYIQMPDVMNGDDGVLYFKNKKGVEYWVKPEEDELIFMQADVPHSPKNAPNSTIDRIVLAGNIGLEFVKKTSSLI